MTREKINRLQEYIYEKIPNCPIDWESFKEILQDAAIHTFGKNKNQSLDWFDENDTEIMNLLHNKHLNRKEVQRRIRTMKNDWFLARASEAETYHKQKKLGEFYATIRQVHGPRSRNTTQIKSKQGKLLTTPEEIKDRWVEHFSDLLNISVETDESILEEFDPLPVKQDLDQPISEHELDKALKNTKLGKSPGPDGILPETLVYGGPILKNFSRFSPLSGQPKSYLLILSTLISPFSLKKETALSVEISLMVYPF